MTQAYFTLYSDGVAGVSIYSTDPFGPLTINKALTDSLARARGLLVWTRP